MDKAPKNAISPTRVVDFSQWYQNVIKAADMAENSVVRGCMVIKPWGYALWENMQRVLDDMIKKTGHQNAYFPLLIPLSFLEKEAKHVEGFAKECAVVTHHRLTQGPDGKLIPDGKLEEPYIIRPTSETIIGHSYSKWVQSYRDLPILINQWANVMRWEMRPRLFLRTSEFLWQEGHTVHATKEEAIEETLKILDLYTDFCENWLAIPVIKGQKTPEEKFPGADETYTFEAMMQDGKAIQGGTSHFLGQNFAKSSEIKFLDKDGIVKHPYTTSWGVTTRLIGGLIMTHGDDDGIRLPPKVAPIHVIIIPIVNQKTSKEELFNYCDNLKTQIEEITYNRQPVRVQIDKKDISGGEKNWEYIKKGVPIRLEIGAKELEKTSVYMGRRDKTPKEKQGLGVSEFLNQLPVILEEIQEDLLQKAKDFLNSNVKEISSCQEFESYFGGEETLSGFALCYCKDSAKNPELLGKLKVTPRCIPLEGQIGHSKGKEGVCIFTGEKTTQRIIFARSY